MYARPLCCLVLSLLTSPVMADDDIDPKGKPKDYKLGATARFAIWMDDAGWHIRNTTASKDQTAFTGTIETVGGKIATITLIGGPSKKPSAPLKANTAKFTISDKINKGLEGGMDLKLEPGVTEIKFKLQIDGKDSPELIFIGAKGEHPKEGEFSLPAKPAKK